MCKLHASAKIASDASVVPDPDILEDGMQPEIQLNVPVWALLCTQPVLSSIVCQDAAGFLALQCICKMNSVSKLLFFISFELL